MNSYTFQTTKSNLEYEIGKSQSVIASVNESTEMPAERKAIWLTYEQARVTDLSRQLVEMKKEYYGDYYGQTGWGVVIGE